MLVPSLLPHHQVGADHLLHPVSGFERYNLAGVEHGPRFLPNGRRYVCYLVSRGHVEVYVSMVEQDYSDIPTVVIVDDSGSDSKMMFGC